MAQPSILLIHGPATGAWLWDTWRRELSALGWEVNVLDLRGHGRSLPLDMATVTMEDYTADIDGVVSQIATVRGQTPVIGGWDMGGLLAMMHAAEHPETPACLLFSPSAPVEVAGRADPDVVRATPGGIFGPEALGIDADDFNATRGRFPDLSDGEVERLMAQINGATESGMAWRQRLRGVSVASGAVRCPSLVVYGEADQQEPPEQSRRVALYLGGESLGIAGAGHWGIVLGEQFVAGNATQLDDWLRRVLN